MALVASNLNLQQIQKLPKHSKWLRPGKDFNAKHLVGPGTKHKQTKKTQTNKQTNKCKTSRGTWRTAAFPPILRLPCPDRASLKRGDCWQESGIDHLCSRWGLRANCLSRSREGSSWRGFCQVGEIRSDYVQTTWNRQLKIPPEIVSWESDVAKGSS